MKKFQNGGWRLQAKKIISSDNVEGICMLENSQIHTISFHFLLTEKRKTFTIEMLAT